MKNSVARRMGRLAVIYALLILTLTLGNPKKLPSVVLIVPFVLLFVAIFLTVIEIFHALRAKDDLKVVGLRMRRPRIVAALFAGLPTLLLVLQSIGQLTIRDALTAGAICIIAYFYAARFSTAAPNR